jgi:hypothetical protein
MKAAGKTRKAEKASRALWTVNAGLEFPKSAG